MKRYLAFGGSTYYPSGGWHDFRGDFASHAEAVQRLTNPQDDFDWWHIIDATTGEKVGEWETTMYRGRRA